jgi:phosphoglycolate phosphatase
MRYQAVLFDLDGTLLDSLADLADSMNTVLAANGMPVHATELFRLFVGDGVENLVRRSLPDTSRDNAALVRRFAASMREEYAKSWNKKTVPYPGVSELLERLKGLGVKLAVLSNKPHAFVDKVLRYYFNHVSFDAAFGEQPAFPRKPDPTAALEISRILAVPPARFLYLGDSNTDMHTAKGAGMLPVGALWGFRTAEELREAGAERLVGDPLEVISLLEKA